MIPRKLKQIKIIMNDIKLEVCLERNMSSLKYSSLNCYLKKRLFTKIFELKKVDFTKFLVLIKNLHV